MCKDGSIAAVIIIILLAEVNWVIDISLLRDGPLL